MTYTNYASAEASISINKNKVKSYGGNFYLQDGQEFQIELFNPTNSTKLAQISMNGKLISTRGIVLKPGQRVHLDRFIDTPKKFKFETYVVDVTNSEVRNAIVSNGDISVSFFDEQTPYLPPVYTSNTLVLNGYGQNALYCTNSTSAHNLCGTVTNSSSTRSMPTMDSMSFMEEAPQEKETGRVEEGSHSNQGFKQYSGKFNSWATNTVYIKILPVSQKPLYLKDLAQYCVECGAKNRGSNYKYCPVCGTKF